MINFNIEDVQNILRKCNVNDLVVHPHEKNKNDDLYIIIVIDDFDNVEVLTVYSFNKRRRERDIERK